MSCCRVPWFKQRDVCVLLVVMQVPQRTVEIGRKIIESDSPVALRSPPSEQELEQGLALEQARNLEAVRLVLAPPSPPSLSYAHTLYKHAKE